MVLDASGLPAVHAVVGVVGAPWPAPDPSMRVDRPAPTITTAIGMSNLVEPLHPVDMPDLTAARRAAAGDHTARVVVPVGRPLPPPTLADAAEHVLAGRTAAAGGRHGTSRRLVVSLAAAAGVACAAVAAAVALL